MSQQTLDAMKNSEAYHTGFEAANQGEPRTANPYASGTWDHAAWLAGWDASQVNLADCQGVAGAEAIRYSSDASVSMVWADGEPVRCPSQHDMDTLPVGDDMDDDELAQCE